ncbi:MAG: bifunctional salicylyl-CoA 5-hydroxylase/oxidoreductase [Myxococcales bacterium]|nr:bifunctional salicylyl-CoA 5-hydroxylase/oxidoreductase [Myxococcales bacterium]MCB9582919.1 bifunctional salicylyl-CoA 5-hydroxylase/oxidoreductase [Polyangiaceae bacterium]
MKIACVGGGPAGLYFALLMKKADPSHEIVVYERNRADDTFGFGVVFSDATLENLGDADAESYAAIREAFAHWDDIDIHYRGQVLTSGGHGFSGMSRKTLLAILQRRCQELGVELCFETVVDPDLSKLEPADLIVACDGVNSAIRERYADKFRPDVDFRPNRFVWLGTTFPFGAFTFYFKNSAHGLFRVHAYRYEEGSSTFIVETTEETWKAAGLDSATEAETIAYCEKLFAEELAGHRLIGNKSIWRSFPTVKNGSWHFDNVVLLGDAAHTAHFSIGSGTKLAMEDAIVLAGELGRHPTVAEALAAYEVERHPLVERTQRAAQVSLEWFEHTERYMSLEPMEMAFSLLTRSLRVTHENLRLRDPGFVEKVDFRVAEKAQAQSGVTLLGGDRQIPPPIFTPFKLRDLVVENRVVVSPMCQYSATDGTVNDWHLVHLGSRAVGGAGLIISEMTDVSADGRISPGCAGLYDAAHVPAFARIVEFVHRYSRTKIGVQLAHAGRKGATTRPWEGGAPLEKGAWPLIAASAIPFHPRGQTPKPMDRADMDRVLGDFVSAARMAEQIGFDMLELHMAHGYLLSSFISPLSNVRTDEYGGSVERRMRFPLEVFDAVRAVWPKQKPISVRISATDWAPGGLTREDVVAIGHLLREHGVDIVDVSAGQTVADGKPRYGRLFQTPFSELVRLEAGISTMTVGNIQSYTDANSIIAAGRADLCVLARAHLYDPYWTRHAAHELGWQLEWPDQYKTITGYNPRFV